MEYLRTAEDRFSSLPNWPYTPHYLFVDDTEGGELRMHYIDEGPHDAAPVLLLHGEPSWSYLYRRMIPGLLAAGHRVIAPDLIGFGRSDKPVSQSDYSYTRHAHWLASAIAQLELADITMFCQDWGGLLGLRLLGERPGRFARVVAANTFLPTGDTPVGEAFERWRSFSQTTSDFSAGSIIDKGTVRALDPSVRAAYDAPFPSDLYKAGARCFPMLVPTDHDDPEAAANRDAWKGLELFDRPFLTAFGDSDPITRGADRVLQARIPGAAGQPHCILERAGHFLQEDQGPKLAEIINDFIENTRET